MGKQSYLSLLILCTILSQEIVISSGENIGKWHDSLLIKKTYAHSNIQEFDFV